MPESIEKRETRGHFDKSVQGVQIRFKRSRGKKQTKYQTRKKC